MILVSEVTFKRLCCKMCGAGVGGDYSGRSGQCGTGRKRIRDCHVSNDNPKVCAEQKGEGSTMRLRSTPTFTLGLTFLMVFVWTKASSLFSSAT